MATHTLDKKTFKPVETVRTARRAYLGLLGMAYDRTTLRLNQVRKLSDATFEDCIERGGHLQNKVLAAADEFKIETQSKAETTMDSVRETVVNIMPNALRFKGIKISKLEAEVEALTAKLERISKTQMETVAVKAAKRTVKNTAQKPLVKTELAKADRLKTATKIETKTDAGETPNVETMPIASLAKAPTSDMAVSPAAIISATTSDIPESYLSYIADVQGYDAQADIAIIRKIVDHCGIALQSRDGKFIACSDETERQTVRESWLVNKLGVNGDLADLDAKVMAVCETMQKDRMKNRVTFYYLMAKNENLLDSL